jgi:ATP phosphoribosyltransferase
MNADKIAAMPEAELRSLMKDLVVDCIQTGHTLQMTSAEILGSVCDTLKEHGLDMEESVDVEDREDDEQEEG